MSFFSKWQTPVDEINSHQTELKQRSLGATSHMTDTHSAESNRQFVSTEREMIQYEPSPAECGKVLMLSNIVPFIQVQTGGGGEMRSFSHQLPLVTHLTGRISRSEKLFSASHPAHVHIFTHQHVLCSRLYRREEFVSSQRCFWGNLSL